MMCLFLSYRPLSTESATPIVLWWESHAEWLAGIPDLQKYVVHTPGVTRDPYLEDDDLPAQVLQLYFSSLDALEAHLRPGGAVQALLDDRWTMTQQVMLVRSYVSTETPSASTQATYLVAYHGAALDYSDWLSHYIDHHIPLMRRLPGLRELEIYTRVDWASSLPIPRSHAVQRNKVVFDDSAAMTAALNSPLRHEMRADYHAFPAFEGANQHYPMISQQFS